ncbi:MAG: sulfoxide reductase heme-binding subunit YedZ [Acidobacteria bacterium]|nr:sulfoxide reductase heme-binding subunit YedZ [Acidobacteriota bacterium]
MQDVTFYKFIIYFNAGLPLALMLFDWWSGRLGANPVEFFLRATGVIGLIFLLVSLLVTPLRRIFEWNGLIKYRRLISLIAFFYICVHLVTYSIFDKAGELMLIAEDVIQRPFILVGMLAFLLMVPLAATSTNKMVKRLGGKNWARLHKLSYVVGVLGVLHFWMIVKSDLFYPVLFAAALSALLGYRIYIKLKPKLRAVI